MIPGISQAVLLPNLSAESSLQWPPRADIHDDLMTAASLAARQKKTVTTSLSTRRGNDSEEDMVIALHLTGSDSFSAVLAILVSIKPSRQSAVLQILQWGESWLQLLLQQQALDNISSREFDAVLMDVQMPVMDGYTAVGKIREMNKTCQLLL